MTQRVKIHLSFALCGSLLVLGAACSPGSAPETLEQVAENPREVAGQTVTVEGEIQRILGPCDYVFEPTGPLETDEVLTLCDPQSSAQPPAEVAVGDRLRVTAVAGTITRQEYEYITTLTVPDDIFPKTETRPVLFIHSAERIQPD